MWIDQKFVVIEKILKDENGSLLDLGSRDQILKKFLPEKIVYTGVDISENKDTNNIIFDLNKNFNFDNESFDFITALDVVEHLDDPKTFLKECLRVTKKKVFINLPNISYYASRFHFFLKGNLGSKYHFSGDNKDDRHKWFTNFYLVKNFFEKNSVNFEIKTVIKQRNKLKPLFYLEEKLAKFFPNLFSWSFLITINKN
tara:strand:- start:2235 stop:2831 length:597 start_codon:yes stop_codon:yes gene_type:complete